MQSTAAQDRERTQDPAAAGDEQQLVVFHLGAELYGVEIARVHEIIRLMQVTRVPRAPSFVEGVINLRGKVIPVVDLRRRFGLPQAEHTRASRIVVVELSDHVVGIIVDGVSEVLRVNTSTVEPPSPVVAGIDSEYLHGIAKLSDRLVILLDLDRILAREERRALEASV
jgi:purine-binding chemotaxis protein CheW